MKKLNFQTNKQYLFLTKLDLFGVIIIHIAWCRRILGLLHIFSSTITKSTITTCIWNLINCIQELGVSV